MQEERISKLIAKSGLCSRRAAEQLILESRVKLDGQIIKELGTKTKNYHSIWVDNKPLKLQEEARLWIYYKPVGLITTHHDPENRKTVFSTLTKDMPRVISVGRLDLNSEGLLLLTNNGALASRLEHPSNGYLRRYRVRVFGDLNLNEFAKLKQGITVKGIDYRPITVEVDKIGGKNSWLVMDLYEGKTREIRNIMQHFGLKVNRLIRISYGPFQIAGLKPGEIKEIDVKLFIKGS
ncbi:Ribosomal large subunit pseudouridine synthase B [Rickettsiales bacterium Ac37b]|nr:Ribosomal large subunit pseudouridine synthase B [Rickettsiales bacterium Ac37b]